MRLKIFIRATHQGLLAFMIIGWGSLPAAAATLTVTSTADSGTGSLRQAIAEAAIGDTIGFNLTYPATITLASTLTITKTLTLTGPGSAYLTVSGNHAVRVFNLTSGTISIFGLTVADGAADGLGQCGAGFRLLNSASVTVDQCIVRNHTLSGGDNYGAAFFVPETATLTVHRSYVHDNAVPNADDYDNEGGAFYSEGTLTITNTTIANNTAWLGAALAEQSFDKNVMLSNCTISGNHSGADGAVTHNWGDGTLTLTNCTLTQNISGQFEAGLNMIYGKLILRNTIIAANLPADGQGETDIFIDTAGLYGETPVEFISEGYNLIGSTGTQNYTWSTGDVVGTEAGKQNPNLGALADSGGYAPIHDPNPGSQAINPASSNNAPFVDSRGYLRVSTSDKGAGENNGMLPIATGATGVGSTSFNANWDSMAGALGYYLDVAANPEFTTLVSGYQDLAVGNVVTYPVMGLTPGTTYYYRVRGSNSYHKTYYTHTITVTTGLAGPTDTATVIVSSTPTPTATLSGTATASLTPTATLTSSTTATSSCTVTPTPTGTLSPTISRTMTPTPLVSATLTVTPSPAIRLTSTLTSTQAAQVLDKAILAYPNPARDTMHFAVKLEQAGIVEIRIYNFGGERVAVLKENRPAGIGLLEWQCGSAAPGMYMAKIRSENMTAEISVAVVK